MRKAMLFPGIIALFGFAAEVRAWENITTTFETTYYGTSFTTELGCAETTTLEFFSSTQITTITITLSANGSDSLNTPVPRALTTEITTIPLTTLTTTVGICTIVTTGAVEKVTVTQFVEPQEVEATSTSTITEYKGTTTIDGCQTTTIISTQTVTGPPSGTVTITSTLQPPGNKMLLRARDLRPRELDERDVVYTTETLPSVTVFATPTCSFIVTESVPGQKITITQFVQYPEQAQTQTPTPAVSPPASPIKAPSPAVSPATPTPTPAVSTAAEVTSPAAIKIPTQPGETITTAIGSSPVTIVPLPSGSGAVVNGVTLTQGGAGTTINSIVVTYAASGLIAVPSSSPSTAVGIGSVILSVLGFTELASGSGVVLASQTLSPGNTLAISGTIYSLPTSGSVPVAVSTQAPAQYTGRASKDGVPPGQLSALVILVVQILFTI